MTRAAVDTGALLALASSRDQSIEIPHSRNWRWKEAIEAFVETRGWTPVAIAWFSAGRPNAS